jgi:hypothetical protein
MVFPHGGKRDAAAVDRVFKDSGGLPEQRRGPGLTRRHRSARGEGTVEALEGDEAASLIDNCDRTSGVALPRFGDRGGKDSVGALERQRVLDSHTGVGLCSAGH